MAGLLLLFSFPDGRLALPWTRPLAAVFAGLCLLWLIFPQLPFNILNYATFNRTPLASLAFGLAWLAAGLAALTYRYRRLMTDNDRRRTRWVFAGLWFTAWATIIVFTLDAAHEGLQAFTNPTSVALYTLRVTPYYLSLGVLALSFLAAILYDRLWEVDLVLNRSLRYGLSSLAIVALYAGAVFAIQPSMRLRRTPTG